MIVVTGATGTLGSQVVEQLLTRVPAAEVAVSVRDPARAAALAERGVSVRHGDFTRPETLADAFAGATRVLLVSANDTGDAAVRAHTTAIAAARTAGVERVVYTSHQAAAADSLFAPMPDHAATERVLADSGLAYTSLRNGFYASTVPRLLGAASTTGELRAPVDGPVSWTVHSDLAEAAVIALTSDVLDGRTAPLTGPAALDLGGVAEQLSQLTCRTIRRVVVEDEEWVEGLVSHGVPQAAATMLLGMFQASRRGEFAVVDPTLSDLLGRPTTPLRTLLETLPTS